MHYYTMGQQYIRLYDLAWRRKVCEGSMHFLYTL
jgi:hypothetical protein